VSALLLFLALASYSPLDPSFNTESFLTNSRTARNWIGIIGAYGADAVFQVCGLGAFLLPVLLTTLGARWFRSRKITSPVAKTLGAVWLMIFVPALFALAPGHLRWMRVIPIEGLVGRIVGDFLIHYLNLAGAYIVCASVLAVSLYFTTAFSFSALQVWAPTRFAFAIALWERFQDWRDERARRKMQKDLEQRRASKPVVTAQMVPARQTASSPEPQQNLRGVTPHRTGIEKTFEPESAPAPVVEEVVTEDPVVAFAEVVDPEVTQRADTGVKGKTTLPRIAGGFKLPPSSLLRRADAQQAVDPEEL